MSEKWKSLLLGGIAGIVNGLLGSGGGTILVPFMERSLKVEEHEAHATAIAVILPLCVISSFFYIGKGVMDWGVFWWVAAGGVVGGLAGAKWLNKVSDRWLHIIFGGFMVVSAVRMIL